MTEKSTFEEEYSVKQRRDYLSARSSFVKECERLLKITRSNIEKCEFLIEERSFGLTGVFSREKFKLVIPIEVIQITYKDGNKETWDLDAGTLIEIAHNIFTHMLHK